MANNYQGYLIKFGGIVLPFNYITEYSSTPNQRGESSAERDQNYDLHRTTCPHTKSIITFTTHILSLDEKIALQGIINSAITNPLQRKATVTYWNDENNNYSTSEFYIPDVEYQVMDADKNTILYNPITFELIEY